MSEIISVILAAGRGNRINLDDIPKPMVPVFGRPLMQDAVESLYKISFNASEIKAVIGHKFDVIQCYFGDDLEYILQENLNGNAGALMKVFSETKGRQNKQYLTIQGDDADQATPENLQRLIRSHIRKHADITILATDKPDQSTHRNEFLYDSDGRVVDVVPRKSVDSRGRYTAGIYLFSELVLKDTLPVLESITPEGEELGISKLIKLAVDKDYEVFQVCSDKEYVCVNTWEGLQKLREKRS